MGAIYIGEGGGLMEAVPGRHRGFQVCNEGIDANPSGIFGGLARLALQTHACWLNRQSDVRPYVGDEVDIWQWNWRQMNLHVDLAKFEHFLNIVTKSVFDFRVKSS